MKQFRRDIWEDGEYTYAAAYGFTPNVRAFLHEPGEDGATEDSAMRDAMLVVPGGGYCMLAAHEGEPVAKAFYESGMNVFVLTYTTDITMSVPDADIAAHICENWEKHNQEIYRMLVEKLF